MPNIYGDPAGNLLDPPSDFSPLPSPLTMHLRSVRIAAILAMDEADRQRGEEAFRAFCLRNGLDPERAPERAVLVWGWTFNLYMPKGASE